MCPTSFMDGVGFFCCVSKIAHFIDILKPGNLCQAYFFPF